MSAPHLGIDAEDLGLDILPVIEQSFGITFSQHDFHENFTYGELNALVKAKLPMATATDCTSQQAFYKLRQALRPLAGETEIRPDTLLANLLPIKRREVAAHLNAELGMDLNLVGMPAWAVFIGSLLVLASLATLYVDWLLALESLGLTIVGLHMVHRLSKHLQYQTVREVVERMSSRYYRQSRRNPDTVNPQEVASRLARIFIDMAGLEAAELVPDAML